MATPDKTKDWKLRNVLRILNAHLTDEEAAVVLEVTPETVSRYLSKHRDKIVRIRCYKLREQR